MAAWGGKDNSTPAEDLHNKNPSLALSGKSVSRRNTFLQAPDLLGALLEQVRKSPKKVEQIRETAT